MFDGHTLILTKSGVTYIKDIKDKDYVWALSPAGPIWTPAIGGAFAYQRNVSVVSAKFGGDNAIWCSPFTEFVEDYHVLFDGNDTSLMNKVSQLRSGKIISKPIISCVPNDVVMYTVALDDRRIKCVHPTYIEDTPNNVRQTFIESIQNTMSHEDVYTLHTKFYNFAVCVEMEKMDDKKTLYHAIFAKCL